MTPGFERRTIVNGGILKQFVGQTVSIMLRTDTAAGTTMNATTTDNRKVRIILPEEIDFRPGAWVEVIGTPENNEIIRSKEIIEFGGDNVDFDTDGYNGLVQLINNLKTIYCYG